MEDPDFINVSQVSLDIGVRYGRLSAWKVRAENILVFANTVKRRIQTFAGITRSEVTSRLAAADVRGELAFSPDLWTDRYKKQAYLGMKGTLYIVKHIYFIFTRTTAIFTECSVVSRVDLYCREFSYQKKTGGKCIQINRWNSEWIRYSAVSKISNLR